VSKMKKKVVIALVMCTVISGTILAATSYVVPPETPGVTPTANYTSWATASTNIQDAIDVVGSGGLVLVTNGVYVLTNMLTIADSITVRSFNNGATDRDGTIIDGNYPTTTNRCVYLSGVGTVLEGFTVTNGYAVDTLLSGNGGGVYIELAGTVTNCLIAGNEAGTGSGGGGIFLYKGGLVTMSTISGNVATNANAASGGGVYFLSSGVVTNCLIKNNRSNKGAGVRMIGEPGPGGVLTGSTIANNESLSYSSGQGAAGVSMWFRGTVDNCTIISNTCARGGYYSGIETHYYSILRNSLIAYNTGATYYSATLGKWSFTSNCVFRNNSDNQARGLSLGTDALLVDSTIVSNTAAIFANDCICRNCLFAYNDKGIKVYNAARFENCTVVGHPDVGISFSKAAVMENCVVYGNNSGGDNWSYSETGTNTVWTNSCTTPVLSGPNDTGNITDNPLFADAASGNYRLTRASPCVNTGIERAWMTGAVDLDGNPRLVGIVDMGAYELPPPLGTCVIIR